MLVESEHLARLIRSIVCCRGIPRGEPLVTVEHLMTHTAGIPDYPELPAWWAIHREEVSTGQLVELFKGLPHAFAPGTDWLYSNSGYLVPGAIIEAVFGMSYGEFVSRHIFAPLGMSSTFYDPDPGRIVPHLVSGYSRVPEGCANAE